MAKGQIFAGSTLDTLNERELVLLAEILRIEDELQRFAPLQTEGQRIMYELLLGQFEMIIDKLSPEDDELWGHVWRVVDWLRFESLERSSDDYSYESMVAQAEKLRGGPLSREEYEQFSVLAKEIAEVDRELSADS